MQDILYFHQLFYKNPNKQEQDNFIVKYTDSGNVKRRRQTTGTYKEKSLSTKFFVRNVSRKTVRVCRNAFLSILCISARRVNTVTKKYFNFGNIEEGRGGFRMRDVFVPKKQCIMNFINSLKCSESHYCRGKSSRQYLPSELNIKTLWKMYSSPQLQNTPVKESYFRMVFNTCYNLGFGSPRSDVCSVCLQLQEKIKSSATEESKNCFKTELLVHKKRAQAFYDLLREAEATTLVLSFDCQKNLPLPQLPDQSVYYSRQFYLFNFTIVRGTSSEKLCPETVTAYVWMENQYHKNSNTIASCVFSYLKAVNLSKYSKLRLVSDGCGGQNKNTTIVTMVMNWLGNHAPKSVKSVELIFPVTGHSYLPPDRVFGLIEKDFKKHEIIQTPEQAIDIVSKHCSVKKVGSDLKVYDFKNAAKEVVRRCGSWHFQISKAKRIYFKGSSRNDNTILVRGEAHFQNDLGTFRNLFVKGTSFNNLILDEVPASNSVSVEKKKDVEKLLTKHYGKDWRDIGNLLFYAHVIDGKENCNNSMENEYCEEREEEENVFI